MSCESASDSCGNCSRVESSMRPGSADRSASQGARSRHFSSGQKKKTTTSRHNWRSSREVVATTPHREDNGRTAPAPVLEGSACRYWRNLAVESLLELAAARQELARVDRDLVELVGFKRWLFYGMVGGTELTLGAFRSKVRHELLTGEHI